VSETRLVVESGNLVPFERCRPAKRTDFGNVGSVLGVSAKVKGSGGGGFGWRAIQMVADVGDGMPQMCGRAVEVAPAAVGCG
jgi:hypothetical protein